MICIREDPSMPLALDPEKMNDWMPDRMKTLTRSDAGPKQGRRGGNEGIVIDILLRVTANPIDWFRSFTTRSARSR